MRCYILVLCTLVSALVLSAPSVEARVVPVSRVERAWKMACPSLGTGRARLWAGVVQKEAAKRNFCPYTLVSIVKFETGSSCNERLVLDRPGHEYSVGLGQINVIHHRDCKEGGLKSPGCQAYISMLMDGASNLRVASSMISMNRDFCRRKTGQPALFARWLSSYQGYNGRQGVWCNMQQDSKGRWRDVATPSFTRKVMNYRHYLARTLG